MEEIIQLNKKETLDKEIKDEFEFREMIIEEKFKQNMDIKEKKVVF